MAVRHQVPEKSNIKGKLENDGDEGKVRGDGDGMQRVARLDGRSSGSRQTREPVRGGLQRLKRLD